ncbi:MAG: shikimate kinase [Sporolactobacillus sp.]
MIYITGFMGAGKTTTGLSLSKVWHKKVYDSDLFIKEEQKQSIPSIFSEYGETFFRTAETEILKRLSLLDEPSIVTIGGGSIIKKQNRALMRSNGIIIFLYCDIAVIHERLRNDSTRPLVQKNQEKKLDDMYQQRLDAYLDADFIINVSGKSVQTIVCEITSLMYQTAQNGNPMSKKTRRHPR